jgi:hypothetical protein
MTEPITDEAQGLIPEDEVEELDPANLDPVARDADLPAAGEVPLDSVGDDDD